MDQVEQMQTGWMEQVLRWNQKQDSKQEALVQRAHGSEVVAHHYEGLDSQLEEHLG